MNQIFVYGTLKRGGSNHPFLAGQTFLGEAHTVPGFRLFDLDGYPGMVSQMDDREGVQGEVWSVDDVTLARLDELEGVAEGLYQRKAVPLLAPFAQQRIEAYLYLHGVEGRRDVGSVWNE